MKVYKDKKYNFTEFFNENNGVLVRTNILDKNGKETEKEAYMRSFPELIDVGIMGRCHVNQMYCKSFGVDCYQADNIYEDMSFENYKKIVNQCKYKTFQIALGGRGDPNKHKDFEKILKYTRENGIIPNLTTTGIFLSDSEIELMKKYCGAVAISLYSKIIQKNGINEESNNYSIKAIEKLVSKKVVTNIHYVISKDTLDDIILRLENNLFPSGINAVIFLLYKPVGLGVTYKVIDTQEQRFKKFLELINNKKYNFKIGFDTCFSPIIISKLKNINEKSIDFCEAARFSCYISPNMIMYPCSFAQKQELGIDIKKNTIAQAWLSTTFKNFQKNNKFKFQGSCPCGLNNVNCKKCIQKNAINN